MDGGTPVEQGATRRIEVELHLQVTRFRIGATAGARMCCCSPWDGGDTLAPGPTRQRNRILEIQLDRDNGHGSTMVIM
ncbi:hypothetical protein ACQPZF_10300 [Actinosynnema sp. CS-041913]|uniref:hypothetical protein n=1 Tax=Actinosynnema sp. CS-041913 TaxID=3239917 RepID=UPI003D92DFF5